MHSASPLKLNGSIVDMTGDGVWPEMSREIRENLLENFFEIDWKIHDISLQGRDATNDAALKTAIADLVTHGAAVKGPTITPTEEETAQFGLKKQYGSPNGAIRSAINGAAIFRNTIDFEGLSTNAPKMKNVTIARMAVGGIYGAPNFAIPGKGVLKTIYESSGGDEKLTLAERTVQSGVALLTTEDDTAIRGYAHAVFKEGLTTGKSVLFAAKSTINPVYDGRFENILQDVFEQDYAAKFTERGLEFRNGELIDAAVSKIPQGKTNGWIVALKNYDGDVTSDQVAGEHVSLGMMDSTLVSADGQTLLADPPHGTALDLEPAWHAEGKLLANPTAHIFAYAEAIRHKAELNGQTEVAERANLLKKAVVATLEAGHLTGDLINNGASAKDQVLNYIKKLERDVESITGGELKIKSRNAVVALKDAFYKAETLADTLPKKQALTAQQFIAQVRETYANMISAPAPKPQAAVDAPSVN